MVDSGQRRRQLARWVGLSALCTAAVTRPRARLAMSLVIGMGALIASLTERPQIPLKPPRTPITNLGASSPAKGRLRSEQRSAADSHVPFPAGLRFSSTTTPDTRSRAKLMESYGKLPLSFEANQGQSDAHVKFLSRGPGYTLFLEPSEAIFALRDGPGEPSSPRAAGSPGSLPRLRHPGERARRQQTQMEGIGIRLPGANPDAEIVGGNELIGRVNYFPGKDRSRWIRGVPTFGKVTYRGIYPGINLVYHGNEQRLEADFMAAPGSDPQQIRLQLEGGRGLQISPQGEVILKTSLGEMHLRKPVAFQEVAGKRREIAASYVLRGDGTVSFALAKYDHAVPLLIDPVLVYSTYLNGGGFGIHNPRVNENQGGHGIAVDSAGNAYVTGWADDVNLVPTPGAYNPTNPDNIYGPGVSGALVAKLNASGTALDYVAIFGDTYDSPLAIAVDPSGQAVVVSNGLFSLAYPAETGPVVAELDATGSDLVYSFSFGTNGAFLTGVTTDSAGKIYVVGTTPESASGGTIPGSGLGGPFVIPLPSCWTTTEGCSSVVFVSKLDPALASPPSQGLVYTAVLGGSQQDFGTAIAVDGGGAAYITGVTFSPDFPTTPESVPADYPGSFRTQFVYNSTCPPPVPDNANCAQDVFVTKINPQGNGMYYSTFLGYGQGWDIAVDAQGAAYVTGDTNDPAFPTTGGAFQTTMPGTAVANGNGPFHAFVTKLNPAGTALDYSTFLGGTGWEDNCGVFACIYVIPTGNIAVDGFGNAYVSGYTSSQDFPSVNPLPRAYAQGIDSFLTKLDPSGSTAIFSTLLGGAQDEAYGLALDPAGSAYLVGLDTSAGFFPTTAGAYEPEYNPNDACSICTPPEGIQIPTWVARIAAASGSADVSLSMTASPNPATAGSSFTYTLAVTNNGPSDATGVSISDPLPYVPSRVTFVSASPSQGTCTAPSASFTGELVCNLGTVLNGGSATVAVTVTPAGPGSLTNTATVSLDQSDPNVANNTATLTLTVNAGCGVIAVSPSGSLPGATLGISYSQGFTATGGTGMLTWSAAPAVPGLTMNASTGVLSGTPTTASTFNFAVTATDQNGCTGNANVSLTVASPSGLPAQVIDNETITVTDTESFPDVYDAETVHVTDAAFVTPLINVGAPVAEFSESSLGFNGQSGSQTITVSDIGVATMTLVSATISGSAQFSIGQVVCSNGATSAATMLPSGGACTLTIAYTASATPAADNATLTFTDNAALSNLATAASGSNYTQSIPLSGGAMTVGPPPPPPAVIPIMDNETIHVTDTESFPDVFDAETVHVTDTVSITVLNTSAGANVTVAPMDTTTGTTPVTVTFSNVTQPGNTTLTTSSSGPAAPTSFELGSPPVVYNLSTTAVYSGTITVCINYAGITFSNGKPSLWHYSGGWTNITTTVNTATTTVCGTTSSLSPFALFQPAIVPPVANAGPSQNMVQCSSHNGTPVTLNGSDSYDPQGEALTYLWTGPGGTVVGTTAVLTITLPLGTYTYTLAVTNTSGLSSTAQTQVTVVDTIPPVLTLTRTRILELVPTTTATGAKVNLTGIASATDVCDANPIITNNAPALFPIGDTEVTFTATDHSGNSTEKELKVEIVYHFSGFLPPLGGEERFDGRGFDEGRDRSSWGGEWSGPTFQAGSVIPVAFQLRAANGRIVKNAEASLEVFLVEESGNGPVLEPITPKSAGGNTGTGFRFDPDSGDYIYELETKGYADGHYLLHVILNDGTHHHARFSIGKEGSTR